MGYSEASQAGIKAHGRAWRKTIKGIPAILDSMNDAHEREDSSAIEEGMRKIGKLFRPVFDEERATSGELEALEWFEEETCSYEMENGTLDEFMKEANFRLHELYDYADYNRIWVDPSK